VVDRQKNPPPGEVPVPFLYPVILRVPSIVTGLKGRGKVKALSRVARIAVDRSADLARLPSVEFLKNHRGAPLPSRGVFWSLAHKPEAVAGIAAAVPVGIDIERLQHRSAGLFRKIATVEERRLLDRISDPVLAFHRCWTAKEAVLKAAGVGLARLSDCRIQWAGDNTSTGVAFDGRRWTVSHMQWDGHLAAVTSHDMAVNWTIGEAEGPTEEPSA
jgi:4'-phosphopantetheinyl transferase